MRESRKQGNQALNDDEGDRDDDDDDDAAADDDDDDDDEGRGMRFGAVGLRSS